MNVVRAATETYPLSGSTLDKSQNRGSKFFVGHFFQRIVASFKDYLKKREAQKIENAAIKVLEKWNKTFESRLCSTYTRGMFGHLIQSVDQNAYKHPVVLTCRLLSQISLHNNPIEAQRFYSNSSKSSEEILSDCQDLINQGNLLKNEDTIKSLMSERGKRAYQIFKEHYEGLGKVKGAIESIVDKNALQKSPCFKKIWGALGIKLQETLNFCRACAWKGETYHPSKDPTFDEGPTSHKDFTIETVKEKLHEIIKKEAQRSTKIKNKGLSSSL